MTVFGYPAVLAGEVPVVSVLAQDSGPGVQSEGTGKATPLALFVILLLLIAVVLLGRSLSRRIGSLGQRFDEERAERAAPKRVRRAEAARAALAEAPGAGSEGSPSSQSAGGDQRDDPGGGVETDR
ncbi:hypothetical protein [Actinopolyspora mortivallis]|uniref:Uncharacterized protein n=1 Tax=Actinopolyspora mortivallis TaxID=33906 RepID=A0A2T0H0M8_ACTMO|nr:hypothetical protein [Actinopolyspora mortivallis]PRW64915.1 hypothetical protein CEP50_03650 [Actinopolyspora mortivallis]